jgi:hypothetical protein
VNQDGSVRELSSEEQRYLSTPFSGGDSGRPYIKTSYRSRDGWRSQSGFLPRSSVPWRMVILPVHPDYDAAVKALQDDFLGSYRAAGDLVVTNADGSITCSPNPDIPRRRRFELSRQYHLAQQRRREALARVKGDDRPKLPKLRDV